MITVHSLAAKSFLEASAFFLPSAAWQPTTDHGLLTTDSDL
jgi:hypothetical protein